VSEQEKKQGIESKQSIATFQQNLEGIRTIKASSRRTQFKDGRVSESPLGDTLYLTSLLTASRLPKKMPDLMIHLSAGPDRLASYWIGEKILISYHPILRNQSVNDIVAGDISKPETARIFQQLEYSSFGEVIHSRTSVAGPNQTATAEKRAARAPTWRLDSKEADAETGLIYFGARYYDPALGLWLSPDPKFPVDGSGGAASVGQLASYSFAAQNPVSKIDPRGRAAEEAESSTSSIFNSRADELYYTDDHWIVFTPRLDVFGFFGAAGEVGTIGDSGKVNAGGYGFKSLAWGPGGAKPGWEKVGSIDLVGKVLQILPLPEEIEVRPTFSPIAAYDNEGVMLGLGLGGEAEADISGALKRIPLVNRVPYIDKARLGAGAEGFGLVGDGRVAVGGLAHVQIGPFAGGAGADVENRTEWGGKALRLFDRWNREFLKGIGQLMGPNFGDSP
jgi:RHS repeat-associated protein